MGKLISQIQNYPLSAGAVAYNNTLLLDDNFSIQQNQLKDYFKYLFEISKNVYFFNEMGTNSNTWNDLLKQDAVFQFSRFLTISVESLNTFFVELPQTNHFNSDVELTQNEYETLCWQRLQMVEYLFLFYKSIGETIIDENHAQILSILKSDPISKLFIQFQALQNECLKDAPVLINNANKINVADLNDIVFPVVSDEILDGLQSYFNAANTVGNKVLNIYPAKFDKIKAANEYAYSIFKNLLQIHQTFNFWANNKLNELVNSTASHTPHVALLIAFCKLKMLYDNRFNQLIHQHTSFIYNDILQFKKQPAQPDTAYVNLELAKNIKQYLIEKDTLFKAGKNSLGKTVYYKAAQNVVLNSAKISNIKSFTRIIGQEKNVICATEDASNVEWQVNDAWLPFNDVSEAFSGIGIESTLLQSVSRKDTKLVFEFTFDKAVPVVNDIIEKFEIKIQLEDDSEESLNIDNIIFEQSKMSIYASVLKNLSIAVKNGINARLKLISPSKETQENDLFVVLFKYLLSEPIGKISVKMNQQQFAPSSVITAAATVSGSESFIAFGSQSLAGSSFRIAHSFLKYAQTLDLALEWSERLKEGFTISLNNDNKSISKNAAISMINNFENAHAASIKIELENDVSYTKQSTLKIEDTSYSVENTLPRLLQIKSVSITADLEENVYEKENNLPFKFMEVYRNINYFARSLRVPFISKSKQREKIVERYKNNRIRFLRPHYNNKIAQLYPLGEAEVHLSNGLTFLPDYTKFGYNDFVADLCIGLTNIIAGQSISLLFNIADETAAQSELEAKISWYFLSNNSYEKIDASKITDTTNNFLQTGIVQLSLPETSTDNNSILYGKNIHWLIARCDKNYEVVANIRSINTNAVTVVRILDENNQETKISVAPKTIENIFPKTANIKSVEQNTASQNGREIETDKHFFWRSSERLRHKKRAVNQWDFEQMILEKFTNIYKVKCLNHAFYDHIDAHILAKSTNTIICLLPHFRVNADNPNFQPAIPMSKLVEIKSYLQTKTTPFNKLQILNTQYDEIRFDIEVVVNKDILDLPFYQQKLNEDIRKFLAPWAFDVSSLPLFNSQKIYMATIVDFIDELSYIHHIKSLKIYKNDLEQFDEINTTSEIHLLTTAAEHTINVVEYGN